MQAKLPGIGVLDQIIVGQEQYYLFADDGGL
jgi:DNA repair protein RadC